LGSISRVKPKASQVQSSQAQTAVSSAADDPALRSEASALLDQTVAIRREIHSHPEVGLDLPRTQELIAERLSSLGLEVALGRSCSSVVSVIQGDLQGPATLLRADMDALEMPEDTGLEFASKVDGTMHACGHDAHVAMLLGAAQLLQSRRRQLAGRVVLMFQPGEEGHDGARAMLEDGLLEDFGPFDRAFALHISSTVPTGVVTTRAGTMMASADEFRLEVTGRGGHASMPHDARDPIPVACEIVGSLQSMVTRVVPAFDPAVVTVSTIHAGSAPNVIPEKVVCEGTVRAVSHSTRELVLSAMQELAQGVARAHGCEADLIWPRPGYPVTVNDPQAAAHALAVAEGLLGQDRAQVMPTPVMGAEDWSYVLKEVPGAMAFLGAAPRGVGRPAPNHSNRFVIDEKTMADGVGLYAALALSPATAQPQA